MTKFIRIDLQTFAEADGYDDEIILEDDLLEDEGEDDIPGTPGGDDPDEPEELEGEDTEDLSGDDDDSENQTDTAEAEEDESADPADPKDKKESALIRYKREAKEAKRKLAEAEQVLRAQRQAAAEEETKKKLIDDGYSEEDAGRIARIEAENQTLRQEAFNLRMDTLEKTYPGISSHKEDILKLKEQLPGMTEAEIYLAKFAKLSQYDNKTKTEQEMLYKQQQAAKKAAVKGATPRASDPVKLNDTDERAFRHLQKQDPSWTRKKYRDLLIE